MKLNKKFNHPLMNNNITIEDNQCVIKFLKTNPRLTNGPKVLEFEKKWSKWLGVKYSLFVNSGSSANILSIAYLKTIFKEGEIIVPSLNWVSNINSILYGGFRPVFVDINLENLGAIEKQIEKSINKKTVAIFLTHILGFNALSKNLLKIIKQYCRKKKIYLIEDVCESHGANYKNKKLGTFGDMSNFSFYYAHHMSTIEGGMVCTNNRKIYESLRIMRSHGMLRESSDLKFKHKIIKKNKNLNSDFIFLLPGYNFRSTEINAVYGINQLQRLNQNNKIRSRNFKLFLKNLDNRKYFTKFDLNGSSNYALIILFKKEFRSHSFRNRFEEILKKHNIEYRRGTSGGGNQTLQPYLNYYKDMIVNKFNLKNVQVVHEYGYYIGNYPELKSKKILEICKIFNSIK